MSNPALYLQNFIKDTCVLIVIAYLLSRVGLLRLRSHERLTLRETLALGGSLGLIGLTESLVPGSRTQYATHTLFATFATFVGGLNVGLITAAVVSLGVAIQTPRRVIGTILAVVVSTLLARMFRSTDNIPLRLVSGFVAGSLAQACRILIHNALVGYLYTRVLPPATLWTIPVNGFGVAVLLLVVSDAQVRAASEQRRLEAERRRVEAERAYALASEAQLAALRARIHPHFLFNALNSITELCCIAPERAEAASINLSRLMRQALETSAARTTTLHEELALVRAYLQIEQERLGNRLCVVWQIDAGCESLRLLPFSIQILVENAINHGLAPKVEGGTITVTVRRSARRILIAVQDDGVGMTPQTRRKALIARDASTHGLCILMEQLRIRYGPNARLRVFSTENRGTLAAFTLPDTECGLTIADWTENCGMENER